MLKTFLDAKPLFYEEIDYDRMPRVYAKIKAELKLPKIIHIIGTNGKGTTGRFLATALYNTSKSVGHYTSPHILKFNERIWLNGSDVSDKKLNSAHEELVKILTEEDADTLSYFEYTTLLALFIYQDVEYVVLEAGLGGEHDATAVFENILTLVTPIDRDHEAFLGNTLEEIARTKLNAIQKSAIIANQKNYEVEEVAQDIAFKKSLSIQNVEELLDTKDRVKIEQIAKENGLVPYLVDNLKLAISALKRLEIEYDGSAFQNSRLFGRLTEYKKNILLDVGHNTLAARAIAKSLQGSKYTLVYNSYRDKNYKEILTLLRPIIESVELIKVDDERAENLELLEETLESLDIKYKNFSEIEESKNYLVFGSFSVVEAFLKSENG